MNPTDLLKEFLGGNRALIVDSNVTARTSLMGTLVQLGAKRAQLEMSSTVEEARTLIRRARPMLLLTDFMVGRESGLDLIQEQKKIYGKGAKESVFVLVTSNGSQSTVARAVEEDADTFIIKPYTLQTFKQCMTDAVMSKLKPSEYLKLIYQGKDLLETSETERALKLFQEAKKLSDKPTLACFYEGQTEMIMNMIAGADASFREGLAHNKIHYKCLTGLFDLLLSQKKYEPAYDVVKKLAQYFPANPNRLATVLRLAILTNNYEDIEGYYRIFTQLDERSDELVRYICSALAITGKYYLKKGTRRRGLELFDKVATSAAGRIQYMRHAVESMVAHRCVKEAAEYLEKFPPELRGKPDYKIAELVVSGATRPSGEVIQLARNLLLEKIEHPTVNMILIEHLAKSGKKDPAEDLMQRSSKKWPEKAQDFAYIMQKALEAHARKASSEAS